MSDSLVNSKVIVTGASQGMGRVHCEEFLRRGAHVAALDIDEPKLTELKNDLKEYGDKLLTLKTDVSNRAEVEQSVKQIVEKFGGIDAVVSNAGNIHTTEGLLDTSDDIWDKTLAIHVGGAKNICRASMPSLLKSKNPRIVIVSSMWAQRGPGFGYAYCAAKGALLAFAKNLAVEFGPQGVLVNAIAPGSVPTRMAADYGPAEIAEDCKTIPMARWGEAIEISKLVCFLASSEASYITGQTIPINGGQIISGI